MADESEKIRRRFESVSNSMTFKHLREAFDLRKKAVLDIGCSFGEFLTHFGDGSVGITVREDEAQYGRKVKLDIRQANIESSDFILTEKFDVVFANNLFEHLYSPHRFLHRVKEYLKPGGILILGVPVIPKVVSLLRFSKFRGSLADSHINFFTKQTLVNTVERAGWEVVSVRSFHWASRWDKILDSICPHFYIVARVDPNFSFSHKRMAELAGYKLEDIK